MASFNKFAMFERYMTLGACIGFARKSIDIYVNKPEITARRQNFICQNRPMLITEKIAVICVHTFISTVYSPYFIVKDINTLEAHVRGIDIIDDDNNEYAVKSMVTHIFS